MAHEQMNLQKHVQDRTVSLLKSARQQEVGNQRALINRVVTRAIEEVDRKLESDSQAIADGMFESALIGISKKSMTYENDPILPLAQATIKEEVSKIMGLSPEE